MFRTGAEIPRNKDDNDSLCLIIWVKAHYGDLIWTSHSQFLKTFFRYKKVNKKNNFEYQIFFTYELIQSTFQGRKSHIKIVNSQ